MEKLLLRGLALEQEWFIYGKGLFVKGFDYGKGPLQDIYLWKNALCKGTSFWSRLFAKGFLYGKGSL